MDKSQLDQILSQSESDSNDEGKNNNQLSRQSIQNQSEQQRQKSISLSVSKGGTSKISNPSRSSIFSGLEQTKKRQTITSLLRKQNYDDEETKQLEDENKQLRMKISTLQSKIYDFENQMDKFEIEKANYAKLIEEKNDRIESLEEQTNNFINENYQLTEQIQEANNEIIKFQELKAEYIQIQIDSNQEISKIQNEIVKLSTINENQLKTLQNLEDELEIRRKQEKIYQLEKVEMENRIHLLESEILVINNDKTSIAQTNNELEYAQAQVVILQTELNSIKENMRLQTKRHTINQESLLKQMEVLNKKSDPQAEFPLNEFQQKNEEIRELLKIQENSQNHLSKLKLIYETEIQDLKNKNESQEHEIVQLLKLLEEKNEKIKELNAQYEQEQSKVFLLETEKTHFKNTLSLANKRHTLNQQDLLEKIQAMQFEEERKQQQHQINKQIAEADSKITEFQQKSELLELKNEQFKLEYDSLQQLNSELQMKLNQQKKESEQKLKLNQIYEQEIAQQNIRIQDLESQNVEIHLENENIKEKIFLLEQKVEQEQSRAVVLETEKNQFVNTLRQTNKRHTLNQQELLSKIQDMQEKSSYQEEIHELKQELLKKDIQLKQFNPQTQNKQIMKLEQIFEFEKQELKSKIFELESEIVRLTDETMKQIEINSQLQKEVDDEKSKSYHLESEKDHFQKTLNQANKRFTLKQDDLLQQIQKIQLEEQRKDEMNMRSQEWLKEKENLITLKEKNDSLEKYLDEERNQNQILSEQIQKLTSTNESSDRKILMQQMQEIDELNFEIQNLKNQLSRRQSDNNDEIQRLQKNVNPEMDGEIIQGNIEYIELQNICRNQSEQIEQMKYQLDELEQIENQKFEMQKIINELEIENQFISQKNSSQVETILQMKQDFQNIEGTTEELLNDINSLKYENEKLNDINRRLEIKHEKLICQFQQLLLSAQEEQNQIHQFYQNELKKNTYQSNLLRQVQTSLHRTIQKPGEYKNNTKYNELKQDIEEIKTNQNIFFSKFKNDLDVVSRIVTEGSNSPFQISDPHTQRKQSDPYKQSILQKTVDQVGLEDLYQESVQKSFKLLDKHQDLLKQLQESPIPMKSFGQFSPIRKQSNYSQAMSASLFNSLKSQEMISNSFKQQNKQEPFSAEDQYTYEGQQKNQKKHGYGVLKDEFQNVIYQGFWEQGEFSGRGCLQNHGQDDVEWVRYEGNFKQNVFHGDGVLYLRNGDKFMGKFVNNQPGGFGKLIQSNGVVIDGFWENGKLRN